MELVLVIAISSAVLFVIVTAYLTGVQSFTREMSRFDIFWEANQALEDITGNIRGCLDVTSAASDSITFWWDDLNDNTSMEADEVMTYSLSGQKLIQTIGSGSKPILDHVADFELEYDNPAYPTLVTVTLTMQKEGNYATLEAKADIRNR